MIFGWLAGRRRRKLLSNPFPDTWEQILHANVGLFGLLDGAERAKLGNILRVIVAEKYWEGCAGQLVDDEVKVTIAGHAALLLLGMDHDYFAKVKSILVYPSIYKAAAKENAGAQVIELESHREGEAWYNGPVILGWDAVLEGGRDSEDARNVVLHEFAHQLDFLDGTVDGTPPLHSEAAYATWRSVMTAEYDRLRAAAEDGRATLLDHYGATNPAEFFAVATEFFFERPLHLRQRHRPLYETLKGYYRQDTALRLEKATAGQLHGSQR